MNLELLLSLLMVPLLVGSAFFSGSETALFGLGENERIRLRRGGALAGRAVDRLLAEPRMLLITLLLGNVTINTLYFVVSSVLLLRVHGRTVASVPLEAAVAMGTLLALILFGEIVPKLAGTSRRLEVVAVVAPPMLVVHRVLAPIRLAMARFVIDPLARLTAPRAAPPRLSGEELTALLDHSAREGSIDSQEQSLLGDVLRLRRLRVRDIQVPRVRVAAVAISATFEEVREVAARERLTRLPVHAGDLDRIVGILPIKRYLAAEGRLDIRGSLVPPLFVPEIASVESLLVHFRGSGSTLAISVDEFGGTAGVVAIEDVVETLVGDIPAPGELVLPPPRRLDSESWQVHGGMSVHAWADLFGAPLGSRWAATIGGLMMERLGRTVEVGDRVGLGNVELEAQSVSGRIVETVVVRLLPDRGAAGEGRR